MLIFSLGTYQFAKSQVFASYQPLFITAFKLTNNLIVSLNRSTLEDDLYVLPFYGGMSLITMLITIKVGAFTGFLTGYLTQIIIKISKRTFVEPYLLSLKDCIQRIKLKYGLKPSSDPADSLAFKDRVYIEQLNSLGQNSVEFIAAWLFPVLIVLNFFFYEPLKITIAKDFLKYFIVFSFIQALAEVAFDVFLNNAIECRTGRLLSSKITDLNRIFRQRKCNWALSDSTTLPGRALLPSSTNLQRVGLGSQHFLTQTVLILGLTAQVYSFELWVNWDYSPFKDYLTVGIIPVVVGVCGVVDWGLRQAGQKGGLWRVKEEIGERSSVEAFYEDWKVYIMRELQEKARRTRLKTAEIALSKLFLDRILSHKEDSRRLTIAIKLLKTIQAAAEEQAKRISEASAPALSELPILTEEEKVLTLAKVQGQEETWAKLEGGWPEMMIYPWPRAS